MKRDRAGEIIYDAEGNPKWQTIDDHYFTLEPTGENTARCICSWQGRHDLIAAPEIEIDQMVDNFKVIISSDWTETKDDVVVLQDAFESIFGEEARSAAEERVNKSVDENIFIRKRPAMNMFSAEPKTAELLERHKHEIWSQLNEKIGVDSTGKVYTRLDPG